MDLVRCTVCEMRQYRAAASRCRRCGAVLLRGSVDACKVVMVQPQEVAITLKDAIFRAVVQARDRHGSVCAAAVELGISKQQVWRILRAGGDLTDHRKLKKRGNLAGLTGRHAK